MTGTGGKWDSFPVGDLEREAGLPWAEVRRSEFCSYLVTSCPSLLSPLPRVICSFTFCRLATLISSLRSGRCTPAIQSLPPGPALTHSLCSRVLTALWGDLLRGPERRSKPVCSTLRAESLQLWASTTLHGSQASGVLVKYAGAQFTLELVCQAVSFHNLPCFWQAGFAVWEPLLFRRTVFGAVQGCLETAGR